MSLIGPTPGKRAVTALIRLVAHNLARRLYDNSNYRSVQTDGRRPR